MTAPESGKGRTTQSTWLALDGDTANLVAALYGLLLLSPLIVVGLLGWGAWKALVRAPVLVIGGLSTVLCALYILHEQRRREAADYFAALMHWLPVLEAEVNRTRDLPPGATFGAKPEFAAALSLRSRALFDCARYAPNDADRVSMLRASKAAATVACEVSPTKERRQWAARVAVALQVTTAMNGRSGGFDVRPSEIYGTMPLRLQPPPPPQGAPTPKWRPMF